MWRFVIAGSAVVVGMGLLVTESYSDLEASVRNMWRQPPYVGPIVPPVAQKQPPSQAEHLRDMQTQIAETSANLDRMREQEQTDIIRHDTLQQQLANLNEQIAQATQALAQAKKELASQRKVTPRKTEVSKVETNVDVDSREAILARLRNPPPVTSDTSPPPRERLVAARQALVEGRVTDAENLLQQAQTQMVFTPVSPQDGNSPIKPNVAASRIDKALARIQEGDVQRALNFIDQAMKAN